MSMTPQEIQQEQEMRDILSAQPNQAGQRDLTTYQKNYLVEAGAGAGKTYIMVNRIVNQLIETDVTPLQVVAITFTKKATQEVQERLSALVFERLQNETDPVKKAKIQGIFDQLGQMQVSTIHGFCQTMLSAMPFETNLGLDWKMTEPDTLNAKAFFDKKIDDNHPLVAAAENRHLQARYLLPTFQELCGVQHMKQKFHDTSSPEYAACSADLMDAVRDASVKWIKVVNGKRDTVQDSAFHRALAPFETLTSGDQYLLDPDFLQLVQKANQQNPSDADCLRLAELINGNAKGILRPYNGQAKKIADCVVAKKDASVDLDTMQKYPQLIGCVKEFTDLKKTAGGKRIQTGIRHLIHCEVMPHLVNLAREYTDIKLEERRADYNDLLRYTRNLLRDSMEARDYFHRRYQVIYVDEFQDTDPLQAELLFYLASGDDARSFPADWRQCKLRPGNLFFVGDPKQGIYRFRGADISIYNTVKEIFQTSQTQGGNEEVVTLRFNFRSDKLICDYVDQVFDAKADESSRLDGGTYQADYVAMEARNPAKSSGNTPSCNGIYSYRVRGTRSDQQKEHDPQQVAAFVHSMVDGKVVIQTKGGDHVVQYEDFLILTSKGNVSSYVQALAERGIPAVSSGKDRLGDVRAIEVATDMLRGLAYPNDDIAFTLILTLYTKISLATIRRFLALADSRNISSLRNQETRALVLDKLSDSTTDAAVALLCNCGKVLEELYTKSRYLTPMATVELVFDYVFPLCCPQEEHQREKEYSLVVQMKNLLRAESAGSLVEIYELMLRCCDVEIENCLALQAQQNCVRIMNPHKAKGLEGKIVILANHGDPKATASSHVKRSGLDTDRYGSVFSKYGYSASTYGTPIGWEGSGSGKNKVDGLKDIEKYYLDAEGKRLLYVAATRAEYMLVIASAIRPRSMGGKTSWLEESRWKPLLKKVPAANALAVCSADAAAIAAINAAAATPATPVTPAPVPAAIKVALESLRTGEYTPKTAVQGTAAVKTATLADLNQIQEQVRQSSRFSISPSRLDGEAPRPKPPIHNDDSDTNTTLVVVDAQDATADADTKQNTAAYQAPYGPHWGTIIHRVLELAVRSGNYTPDILAGYSRQAIWETMKGTVLSKSQSEMVYGDTPLAQQEDWLQKKVCEAVRFASDENSPFRKLVAEGTTLPELAFFAATQSGEFYDHLQSHIKEKEGAKGKALDVQGFIDLAIHTDNGWIILDYKTNQQRPGQSDSNFDHHLANHYRSQLEAYSKLLKEQTGEDTVGCYLCAIHSGGRLIDLDNLPPEDKRKAAPVAPVATATTTPMAGTATPLAQITGPYANSEQFTLYVNGTAVLLTDKKGGQVDTIKKCKTFVVAMQSWLTATYPGRDFAMKLENRGAEALMTMLIKRMRKELTPQEQDAIAIRWQSK